MIWEAHQQRNISNAQQTADRAKSKADRFSHDIADIKQQMGRLSLACQAMWELLRDFSELTEKDIENKILEVDLRDGRTDGKMRTQLLDCHACGKRTNSRRSICVMCGAPLERPHKFEP